MTHEDQAQEHFNAGLRLILGEGNVDEEVMHFESALQLGLPVKDEVQARAFLGDGYKEQGRHDKAQEELEKALKVDDDARGQFLTDRARKMVKDGLGLCYAYRANDLRIQKKLDEANACLEKATHLSNEPDVVTLVHLIRGKIYQDQRAWDMAIMEFKNGIRAGQDDIASAELHRQLGIVYHEQHEVESAINELEVAVSKGDTEVAEFLSALKEELNKEKRSKKKSFFKELFG